MMAQTRNGKTNGTAIAPGLGADDVLDLVNHARAELLLPEVAALGRIFWAGPQENVITECVTRDLTERHPNIRRPRAKVTPDCGVEIEFTAEHNELGPSRERIVVPHVGSSGEFVAMLRQSARRARRERKRREAFVDAHPSRLPFEAPPDVPRLTDDLPPWGEEEDPLLRDAEAAALRLVDRARAAIGHPPAAGLGERFYLGRFDNQITGAVSRGVQGDVGVELSEEGIVVHLPVDDLPPITVDHEPLSRMYALLLLGEAALLREMDDVRRRFAA